MHFVDESSCTGCGSCLDACTREAITIDRGIAVIDNDACDDCGSCFVVCPQGAVYREETAVEVAATGQPSQVTVSTVVPVKRTPRWLAALAAMAPTALDLTTELIRSLSHSRVSRAPSGRDGASFSRSAKAYNRHRWRGGRN